MSLLSILGFGLLLGIKHAFDADHLIAVSTILAEHKNSKRAALIGTFWGIGHTTTLFIVGLAVLLLRLTIPEPIAEKLEGAVGVMLVLLGVQAILQKLDLKEHSHSHEDGTHTHIEESHSHRHKKSFLIGSVHGLAGSGALMVLVLSLITSVWEGVLYIIVFGLGSTLSMTLMSLLIGIPFAKSMALFSKTERYIRVVMGSISVLFGGYILYSLFGV